MKTETPCQLFVSKVVCTNTYIFHKSPSFLTGNEAFENKSLKQSESEYIFLEIFIKYQKGLKGKLIFNEFED